MDVGQDDGWLLTAQGKHIHTDTHGLQQVVHGAQAKGTVGVGADMTCGRAHTRGCMRYCSPTPTWRADTRQACGKPQRNQVPDQLCDIRRSPSRLFSCSLLACLPRYLACLLEYVCSHSRKKKKRVILRNWQSVPTLAVVSKLSVTSTIDAVDTSSASERQQKSSAPNHRHLKTSSPRASPA